MLPYSGKQKVFIDFIDKYNHSIDKPNLITLSEYGILLVGKECAFHKGVFIMEEKIVFCKSGG